MRSAKPSINHISLLIILLISLQIKTEEKVIQIIGLIRSSASYPESGEILKHIKIPSYQQDSEIYEEISGNGLRSSWILGKDLVNRYPFILDNSKNLKDFKVVSSKSNRCLMTTQGLMLGVFDSIPETRTVDVKDEFQQPPFNGESIQNDFKTPLPDGVYPVPFQSYNKEFNNVLRPWDSYGCKSFLEFKKKDLEKENKYIDRFNELLDKSSLEIKTLLGGFKKHVADYQEVIKVSNYLTAMRNMDVKFDLEDNDLKEIQTISSIYESLIYVSEDAQKVILYRLNNQWNAHIDEMENALKEGNTDYSKYALYVGHFPSLWAMMGSFKLASSDCLKKQYDDKKDDDNCFDKPVYNSSIILKIYEDNNEHYVKVFFNGNDITSKLKDCSLTDKCPLQNFRDFYLKENIFATENDYDIKCANYDVNLNKKLIALSAACLLFSVVMLIVFIKLLKKKLKRN